jgi:hypothetical protein
MKRFWIQRGLKFAAFGALFIGLSGLAVMALWNALLPAIVGVTTITFGQALGLLVLSRLLFGGFGGRRFGGGGPGRGFGGGPRGAYWKEKMAEKWQTMTPEQRADMKAKWADRCGDRGNRGRHGERWNDGPMTDEKTTTTAL